MFPHFTLEDIRQLVIDLNSLPELLEEEERPNFDQMLSVLTERDFKVVLLSDQEELAHVWRDNQQIVFLETATETAEVFEKNESLLSQQTCWITEEPALQQYLCHEQLPLAFQTPSSKTVRGLQYQNFHDLLAFFHPSQQTATVLSQQIYDRKASASQQPLIIGVGGPDECGHAFFVERLVEELEQEEVLVEGLDLTNVLGTEFYPNPQKPESYWRSVQIQKWVMDHILLPFANGERVFIETPPHFIEEQEITNFPLFLSPEMILVVWGTTLFLPEFQELIDWGIVLDLSSKAATARLFGLNEKEDFDPKFIEQYEQAEGRLYRDYLGAYDVIESAENLVNFDNYHAFRLHQPTKAPFIA